MRQQHCHALLSSLQEWGFDSLDRLMLATDGDYQELGLKRGEVRALASALSTQFGPKQVLVTVAPSAVDSYRQEEEEKAPALISSSSSESLVLKGKTSPENISNNSGNKTSQSIPAAPALTVGSSSDTSAESISTLDSGNSTTEVMVMATSAGTNDAILGDKSSSSNGNSDSSINEGRDAAATALTEDGKSNLGSSSSSTSSLPSYGNAKELKWSELKVGDVVGEGSFGQVNDISSHMQQLYWNATVSFPLTLTTKGVRVITALALMI